MIWNRKCGMKVEGMLFRHKYILVSGCVLDLCDRILLSFVRKFLGNLSMFSVQFYVNFLTTFYNLKKKISHYQGLFQDRAHVCNIYPKFWYFRNKDHWWGLRPESKRLKVYNFLSYHFWTLKPIMNNNIVLSYYSRMNFIIKLWIKGFNIQKTKITSKFAYEITLYDFSYIKYFG